MSQLAGAHPLLIGGGHWDGHYQIPKSLRFRSGVPTYLYAAFGEMPSKYANAR